MFQDSYFFASHEWWLASKGGLQNSNLQGPHSSECVCGSFHLCKLSLNLILYL